MAKATPKASNGPAIVSGANPKTPREKFYHTRGFIYRGTGYLGGDEQEGTVDVLVRYQPQLRRGEAGFDPNFYFVHLKPLKQGGRPISAGQQSLDPKLRASLTRITHAPKGITWQSEEAKNDDV